MKLEYISETFLENEIRKILAKYVDLTSYKAFFFGSRVKGDSFIHSDIDVGIEGNTPLPTNIKSEIEDEFENIPTLYKIEFVDFNTVSDNFKNEALKYIQPI